MSENGWDSSGKPFEFKGSQYVALAPPLREKGGNVSWDNESKVGVATYGGHTATITMTDENVKVDGNIAVLSAPPLVKDGVLYVPTEFFPRIFGFSVL